MACFALAVCLLEGIAAFGSDSVASRAPSEYGHTISPQHDAQMSGPPAGPSPAVDTLAENAANLPKSEARAAPQVAVVPRTPRRVLGARNSPDSGPAIQQPPEADSPGAYMPPQFGQQSEFGSLLSRLLVATVGVLIACCVTLLLAKKYLVQSQVKTSPDGVMKLLATLPVSRRGCVQLVQVEDTKIVVAVDGGTLRSMIPLTESFGTSLLGAVENVADMQPRRRNGGKN